MLDKSKNYLIVGLGLLGEGGQDLPLQCGPH